MRCVVGNSQLGTWCRAIHSLTQVGDDDIYFDFNDDILTVSTANSSNTAFATFLFFKTFFSSYQMVSDESEKVSIPAKIILKPYRTQKVAKSYLSSEIHFEANQDFLTVTSEGKSHVRTTYKLGASSTEDAVECDSDPYTRPNCLKAEAKVLSNCLSNFSHVKGLAEINFKIEGQKVILRNCVTDISRKDGSVVTEYNLTSYDFIEYEVSKGLKMDVSFGFREFKIFTSLAEHLKLPVSIHFEGQDNPVIILVKTDTFEARLCMATRTKDPFATTPQNSCPQTSSGTNGRISNVTSQSSTLSVRSISQEVNRRPEQDNGANGVTIEVSNPDPEQPPSKRPRRTEAPPASIASPVPVPPTPTQDRGPPVNPDTMLIGPMVDMMEKRQKSAAYKTIQRVMAAPHMTEEEYLRTIPGHDIVLCPDSDEEEEN